MKRLDGYMAGANLGHWISQYGRQVREHWDEYITEPDFRRMSEWGLDHVRLPVDYFLFERDDRPGEYDPDGLRYIDFALDMCGKYGLNMILDLHHAPGFFFGGGEANSLFTDPAMKRRFTDIWRMFAARYKDVGDRLIFELMNELVWENSDPWNDLWPRTAEAVHEISPGRRIIVGGNRYNSAYELKNLLVTGDERIIYNFHFYEPFLFTHQRAAWTDNVRYQKSVVWPFSVSEHSGYYKGSAPAELTASDIADKDALRRYLAPAFEFAEKTGKTLYCGEYGVIANADDASAARWLRDIGSLLSGSGIGRAVWSYRGFSSITSPDDKDWNREMAAAIAAV